MTVPLRATLNLRVSTARQAEHDVSVPDQRRQGEAYCAARGYQLVETFMDAGASAANDRHPEFQQMIEAKTTKPAPFEVVVVHTFIRLYGGDYGRDHVRAPSSSKSKSTTARFASRDRKATCKRTLAAAGGAGATMGAVPNLCSEVAVEAGWCEPVSAEVVPGSREKYKERRRSRTSGGRVLGGPLQTAGSPVGVMIERAFNLW